MDATNLTPFDVFAMYFDNDLFKHFATQSNIWGVQKVWKNFGGVSSTGRKIINNCDCRKYNETVEKYFLFLSYDV